MIVTNPVASTMLHVDVPQTVPVIVLAPAIRHASGNDQSIRIVVISLTAATHRSRSGGQDLHYGVTMSKPVQHRTIDQGRGPITRYSERSHDVMKRCQTDLEFAV